LEVNAVHPRRGSISTTIVFLLSALCEGFDVQAAGVAAAGLNRELHATPSDLGLFFTAAGAGLLIGSLVGGRISDRVGRKLVLITSISAFGAFSLLTAFAPTMSLLTAARFLTGIGLGGALPNLIALAADISALSVRNRTIGVAFVGMPIGGSLASVLAFLLPLESWRHLFLVGGLAPILIVPALVAFLPGGRAPPTTASPAAAHVHGIFQELLGRNRALKTLLLWLSFFLGVLMLHLMLNWLPLLLTGRGLSKDAAMSAQAGFNCGGALLALCQAALLDTRWRWISILVCIAALPVLLFCAAVSPAWPLTLGVLAMLLGGAILAQQVTVYASGSACYPTEARGTGVGAAVAAGRVGSLLGPLFGAALIASGHTAAQVLLGVLPLSIACGGCVGLVSWQVLGSRRFSEA
jgi:AAHS family 3-hydroxyphenylpropionic acid transporter